MIFQKESLDMFLVPSGLLIMFGYHLLLLYKYLNHEKYNTVLGFEFVDKKDWVDRVMKMEKKDNALTVLTANANAANSLATISLTLGALIGAWIANMSNVFESKLIYGDIRASTMSIKYICLLTCFVLAFSCFIQSARSFIHSNYLVSVPDDKISTDYVAREVIKGGDFWSLGLRSLYFATNLLLWFFGPIPMFATSVIMVALLHYLDTNTKPLLRNKVAGKHFVGRV